MGGAENTQKLVEGPHFATDDYIIHPKLESLHPPGKKLDVSIGFYKFL